LAGKTNDLDSLTREELISRLEAQLEGGIRIAFSGKANARSLARRVRPRVTRTVAKYSAGDADAQARNLLIEGDNLQAMATLYRYRGQVDLVLTDPPYNTGNDFRYNDKWETDPNDDGIGEFISADEAARHTKWMRFMWPRLQMMKAMLKPTGVLAICIDHRELFQLGQMLDETFGRDNRIGVINWQKNYTPRNDNQHISTATEYVLVYARNAERAKTHLLPRTEQANARFTNPDDDPHGPWASNAPHAPSAHTHAGMVYAIQSPFTGRLHYPPERRCWAVERPTMKRWLEEWGTEYVTRDLKDGRASALLIKGSEDPRTVDDPLHLKAVAGARELALARRSAMAWPTMFFTGNGDGGPRRKIYLEEVRKGVIPMTYWADDDFDYPLDVGCTSWDHEESGHNQTGIHELDAVVGPGHGFQTVKPLKLFQKVIQLWCPPSGIVLDAFAGSGTTGHAVLAMNSSTDSDRRFILVEQGRPEKGDTYARSLTSKRLVRVVNGKWANKKGEPLGGGFTFLALAKKVDADGLLRMERSEMVDAVIGSHFEADRRGPSLVRIGDGSSYLVARNAENEGVFLVWNGPTGNTNFTREVYRACVKEARDAGLTPTYHVYARLYVYQTGNVVFYQIPDRILADFGLDLKSEPFADASE
jgi:adenine-specific DNA-methyltransferase